MSNGMPLARKAINKAINRGVVGETGVFFMTNKWLSLAFLFAAMIGVAYGRAHAAPCGNNSGGFEGWKKVFAGEASGNGLGPKAIAALMATQSSVGTSKDGHSQNNFK